MDGESLEVSLANELREIAGVAARIDEFCAAHDLGHAAYAVNLAIDEILTNTIEYGYEDDAGAPARCGWRTSTSAAVSSWPSCRRRLRR